MGCVSKGFSLLLVVVLAFSSLVVVESVFAQSIPKPSTPEFSLKYIDLSYDVPPTYGVDQFTGKTVITQQGYHVDNQSIAFKIKNQPFTSHNDSSGNNISLYYNFKFKGHFGTEWSHYPFNDNGQGTRRYFSTFFVLIYQSPKLPASNSEYTNIVLGLPFLFGVANPSVGSQVDFQVQALIGHIDYAGDGFYSFTGQSSDWSNTQTITISSSAPTATPKTSASSTPTSNSSTLPTQNPTASPSQSGSDDAFLFGLDWKDIALLLGVLVVVLLAVVVVVFLLFYRRHRKPATLT